MWEVIAAGVALAALILKIWWNHRKAHAPISDVIEKRIEERRKQTMRDRLIDDHLRRKRVDRLLREARDRLDTKRRNDGDSNR